MKNLKLLVVALVAMFGFTACDKHVGNDHDHSADLVGTWTCLTENYAEALIIKADGTAVSYGVEDGEYWENVKGTVSVKENNITMIFEDDDNCTGHFDVIPGMAFSLFEENGERYVYQYCANDLSDEIVGMWVCYDGPTNTERDMLVQVYQNDGCTIKTGWSDAVNDFITNNKTNYKVVGDLIFYARPTELIPEEMDKYVACRIDYVPNGLSYGDKKTVTGYIPVGDDQVKVTGSWLRIKQHLELSGNKYDYIKTYVTNVKGVDKDVDVMGYTFNFAKMDGVVLDKMLKTVLFAVEFPDANTIRYSCKYNEFSMEMDAPIVVDGNKMTVKMSQRDAAYKDVDLYTFQDQDSSQMHMYMHSTAFVNFFGNMQIAFMSELGQLDKTDANAVKAVFDSIDAAVESINLSLVMTKARK